jgi:hypothetical protein
MIKQFKILTTEECELLLKGPALVSVLASCSLNKISKVQKADAIKLSHLKTFTANPILREYYEEVDKQFETQFDCIVKVYFPFDENKRQALKKEIEQLNLIIAKLEKTFGEILHKSLDGYANHVRKAAHSVFQDFIFPLPIHGLSV